jgi:hypothetical protein
MSDLAENPRQALGDRLFVSALTLNNRERRHLRMVAGSRTALTAAIVEAARVNPGAREVMECLVLLHADLGASPEEISERTAGALTPEVVVDIIECWRRESDEFNRRHAKLGEILTPDRLTLTMRDILTAAKTLKAVDLASARPACVIADEAGHPNVNTRNVRRAFKKLREDGLLDAQAGMNGGTWITSKGLGSLSR